MPGYPIYRAEARPPARLQVRDISGAVLAHARAARRRAAERPPRAPRARARAHARAARRPDSARGRAQALWARATQAGALREEAEAARAAGQQAALAATREQLEQWDLLMGNSARLEAENRRLRRAPAPGAGPEYSGASRSSACHALPRRRRHAHTCGGEVCPGLLVFKNIRAVLSMRMATSPTAPRSNAGRKQAASTLQHDATARAGRGAGVAPERVLSARIG
jgi:hypothetical protein